MKSRNRNTLGCLLSLLVAGLNAQADVVTDWNEAALNAIRAQNTSPPAASRNLAILHLAIYDAVNGIARTHEPYKTHAVGTPPASASREAAASTAAYHVMSALYPVLQPSHDALFQSTLRDIPNRPQKTQGVRWGEKAAAAILAARSNDGATTTEPYPGSMDSGDWRPTISFGGVVRPALLPLWGEVTPFVLNTGSQLRPPGPPPLNSHEYAANINQVKAYGAAASSVRTADQTQIALFWSYGPTTATPPGHWNQIATAVSLAQDLSLEENARLYALLNIAMADAAIACWDCKYAYNLWRPITAIALADTDDNPETTPDPAWVPLLATPPFPEYSSGHSTFSGAAAATMALFFGTDDVAFTVGSDDLPGVQRAYPSFSAAAEESGLSRILGGIHYMFSNRRGLDSGAMLGEMAATGHLRPQGHHSRRR